LRLEPTHSHTSRLGFPAVQPHAADRRLHHENAWTYAPRDHENSSPRTMLESWPRIALVGSAAALGAAAVYNVLRTKEAEREHPAIGKFINVDGVRLHYIERGRGDPLVLIHGNGTLIQDFTINGLVDRLAETRRVIVIERPGYGYSTRPRWLWTPRAHATLFEKALRELGVHNAVVLGHSWGTMVAVALALQAPNLVRSLVLLSGYYYPTARLDVALFSPPAIPVVGDAMRYTVSPLIARLILPGLIKKMFEPAAVPEHFQRRFPHDLMLRPIQLRASAEDAALMTPAVMELQEHYRDLKLPIMIVTVPTIRSWISAGNRYALVRSCLTAR
jgi:pimeloyl-ACP methyl ester carboxylesterase